MFNESKILKSLQDQGVWNKIFDDSGRAILRMIVVEAASKMKKSSGLPVRKQLTMRSGNLARELQSKQNISSGQSSTNVTISKHMRSPYAYLLTEGRWAITEKQRRLFKFFASRSQDRRWRNYWWFMSVKARFLYGRGYIEDSIESNSQDRKLSPIYDRYFKKHFPIQFEVIEIGNSRY